MSVISTLVDRLFRLILSRPGPFRASPAPGHVLFEEGVPWVGPVALSALPPKVVSSLDVPFGATHWSNPILPAGSSVVLKEIHLTNPLSDEPNALLTIATRLGTLRQAYLHLDPNHLAALRQIRDTRAKPAHVDDSVVYLNTSMWYPYSTLGSRKNDLTQWDGLYPVSRAVRS